MNIGILGSTGYAGMQLIELLHKHPEVKIKFLGSFSQYNKRFDEINRKYGSEIGILCSNPNDIEEFIHDIDVVFLALPHTKSLKWVKLLSQYDVKIIDFSGDFRFTSTETYEQWYETTHTAKELNSKVVYGLPELNRSKIKSSQIVANPGCYPTASILGLAPLADKNLIEKNSIIIDAKSGISGVGKKVLLSNIYCEASENTKAYSIGTHRHTPEIEENINGLSSTQQIIQFTPNVVPMHRGILATIYVKLSKKLSENDIYKLFTDYYKDEPFIRISYDLPETKYVTGTNYCDIAIRKDSRTNTVIIFSAIDNLIKGAAGQAIHNMNIIMGIDELTGLTKL